MTAARHFAVVGVIGGTAIGAALMARSTASALRGLADVLDAATEAIEPWIGKLT